MKLVDRVAQCRVPLIVHGGADNRFTHLNNTAECADAVARCPLRYVLADDLTRLCADLAYSKGARTVVCADLLHVPAQTLWIEWCNEPWQRALAHYGFRLLDDGLDWTGRRGALIQASPNGRRGLVRTFWTVGREMEVRASAIEAYFDFDTLEGEMPQPLDRREGAAGCVADEMRKDDMLGRCFRFRYEESWEAYYGNAILSDLERAAIWHHSLGTVAMTVPMLLAFLLLLATRSGLPKKAANLERLNRQRLRAARPALLDHIEIRAPLLPEYRGCQKDGNNDLSGWRRRPRLHHVRGHLVRRGGQIFWRVPHLRGSARVGTIQSRTVIWTFDQPQRRRSETAKAQAPGAY